MNWIRALGYATFGVVVVGSDILRNGTFLYRAKDHEDALRVLTEWRSQLAQRDRDILARRVFA